MSTAQLLYTAGQIGQALGVTAQAIKARLVNTPPGGTIQVRGQKANGWAWNSLPELLRGELTAMGERRGLASVEMLFAAPVAPWTPPIPWNLIPKPFQERAEKLRDALAPVLARQHELSGADLMDLARTFYRQHFGNELQDDKLRYILDRATKRDRGFQEWQRVDLFVEEAAFHQPAAPTPAPELEPARAHEETPLLFHHLDEELKITDSRTKPTLADRVSLLQAAFLDFRTLLGQHHSARKQKAIKRLLVDYLYHAVPGLYRPQTGNQESFDCKPLLALRQLFNRCYKKWDGTVESIMDKRPSSSGRKPKTAPKSDRELFIDTTVACDGNFAQAFRRIHQLKEFSPEFADRFPFDPQNKSHVPPTLLNDVRPDVLVKLPSRWGPDHTSMISPKGTRDWSKVAPYDFAGLDDVTWNFPFAIKDKSGKTLVRRGECILSCATRVNYILHHTLIASVIDGAKSSFNALHVRGHILALHDKVGLPYVGLDLEHNVFAARIIRGEQRPHWREAHPRSFEQGLRHADLGIDLHYHIPGTPWTKPIERVIGMVQDRMNCEPLYIGRNQRLDRREGAEAAIRAVESGKATPEEVGMLWFDQFSRMLDAVIQEYNREIQNGEMLMDTCGRYLSPEDAFINGICGLPGISRRPAKVLTAKARARLSTHSRKMYVHDAGLIVEVDGRRYPFFDENLEPYRHKDVIAHLNIEVPEVLICSDLKETHFFPVKCHRYDARGASPEQIKTMSRDRAKFMARSRVKQSEIKPPVISTIARDSRITAPTLELGAAVNEAVSNYKAEESRNKRAIEHSRRKRAALGVAQADKPHQDSRIENQAIGLGSQAERDIAAMTSPSEPEATR